MFVYSNELASYYDSIMGENSDITKQTVRFVKKYATSAKTVLELGVGTGTVLNALPKGFELHGLDISEGMIRQARRKLPSVTFYLADMSTFSVNKKFDLIFSVFDSMNHLLTFSRWKRTFARVHTHLKNEGVFIFDMNTPKRLETLSHFPAYIHRKNGKIFIEKCMKEKPNLYAARFQVVSAVAKKPKLLEENIYEAAFSVAQVEKELLHHFTIVEKVDPYRKKVSEESGRVFFVCRKNKQSPR